MEYVIEENEQKLIHLLDSLSKEVHKDYSSMTKEKIVLLVKTNLRGATVPSWLLECFYSLLTKADIEDERFESNARLEQSLYNFFQSLKELFDITISDDGEILDVIFNDLNASITIIWMGKTFSVYSD